MGIKSTWRNRIVSSSAKIVIAIGISFVAFKVFAANLPAPPPLPEETVVEQDYFQKIYNNWNTLEVVDSNPDGTRSAKKGAMVLLSTGGNYYLEINVDGDKIWSGVAITNTP